MLTINEYCLQSQISESISLKYPHMIYHFDLSGIRLSIGQAIKVKKLNPDRAFPDLFIAEARHGYHGLFVEIKLSRNDVYRKNGELVKNSHIHEQAIMLKMLEEKGYKATFGYGFDHTMQIIDEYMSDHKGGRDHIGKTGEIPGDGLWLG